MANDSAQVEGVSYKDDHYLLFGCEGAYDKLDCEGAARCLEELGFSDNSLTQARKRVGRFQQYAGYKDPSAHHCDFCGCMLSGVEYEVLKDGRERCGRCSDTVIKRQADFESLFLQVREGLCAKYGITIPHSINVKVVSQAKMAKMQGSKYVPTKYFDARAIGLAISRRGNYEMCFENGTPRLSLIATTAHELTHIWQYSHWDWAAMQAKYGGLFLAVCEGMAKWVEIQYLYLMNETAMADRVFENEVARTDVYGYGLKMFLNQYPLSKSIVLQGPTPFADVSEPIDLALVR